MKKILVIESSPSAENSFSNKLSQIILAKIRTPDSIVKIRSLPSTPPPLLTSLEFGEYSNEAIAELLAADTIIIGVALHNFGIPALLKAWIDQIARAGQTFSYSAEGPKGLVTNKKVYLAIASGAVMSVYPGSDHSESYLRTLLSFLGMTDITAFRVEGLAIAGIKETAFDKANEAINILA